MDNAVVLYFDKDSENRLLNIMKNIINQGVNSYMTDVGIRPHITLAAWFNEKDREYTNEIEEFTLQVKGIKVLFSSIGVFPSAKSVVYLSPVKDDNLMGIHQKFYKHMEGKIDKYIDYYTPNHWVPHCTLATKLSNSEVLTTISSLLDKNFPLEAVISQVGLIKCNPVEEILSCDIKLLREIDGLNI